jgi:hypothetical protein
MSPEKAREILSRPEVQDLITELELTEPSNIEFDETSIND